MGRSRNLPVSLKFYQLAALSFILLFVLSTITVAQSTPEGGRIHRVLVRLNTGFVPEGDLSGVAAVARQRIGIRAVQDSVLGNLDRSPARVSSARQYQTIPYLAMAVDDRGLAELENNPLVASVSEQRIYYPSTASANLVVRAPQAWATGNDGTGQIVAILDTGVDFTHPALAGKAIDEACFSNDDYPDDAIGATLCPNGDTSQYGPGAASPTGFYCTYVNCGHGTHVAGIAAGNTTGFSGIAPGADIIAVNVFSFFWDCFCVGAWDGDILLGLEYVYLLSSTYPNIASVNMSLGGGYYTTPCDGDGPAEYAMIDNLRSAGIAVIAASGNEGYRNAMSAPACLSNVISVGATSDSDAVASLTNIAPFLDFLAPGLSVTSSVPGGGYSSKNGTSMATPYIAGAWAIMRQSYPDFSLDDVEAVLKTRGRSISAPDGRSYPRLDVFAALPVYIPSRPAELSLTDQQLLDAMQAEAEAAASGIRIILVVFQATRITVYAEVDGVTGIMTFELFGGQNMGAFVYKSVTTPNGATPPAALVQTLQSKLPPLVSAAIDRLLDGLYPSGYEVDYLYVLSHGLYVWVETP
jgi:hypothetical protein